MLVSVTSPNVVALNDRSNWNKTSLPYISFSSRIFIDAKCWGSFWVSVAPRLFKEDYGSYVHTGQSCRSRCPYLGGLEIHSKVFWTHYLIYCRAAELVGFCILQSSVLYAAVVEEHSLFCVFSRIPSFYSPVFWRFSFHPFWFPMLAWA